MAERNGMPEIDPDWEISVQDVKTMLDRPGGPGLILIDVREPNEHAHCRIPQSRLMPMREIPQRVQELAKLAGDKPIVCHCHHGGRSLRAAEFLRQAGIENVKSMAGGIDAWSERIDPSVPRY